MGYYVLWKREDSASAGGTFMMIPEKLRYARERAGLTGAQVRERTGIGESSLSEFENGKREPRLSQLQALASVYRRSLAFLLSEQPIPRELVLWRERPVEAAQSVEAAFLRLCEQYHNLEVWCGDRTPSRLPDAGGTAEAFDYAAAEDLAMRVRRELQLGDRPGPELLRVLEEVCGVKVFHSAFEPSGAAASTKSEAFGDAVLLNASNVRWRRNFDLAHELFHLLTWRIFRSETESWSCVAAQREEKLATCFARNLLMPAEATRAAVNSRVEQGKVSFEALFGIARQFDVSAEALLWQMHFLYNRGPGQQDVTERDIDTARRLAPLLEERGREDTRPPRWPERYRALAVKALRRGEMSIGRFAEVPGDKQATGNDLRRAGDRGRWRSPDCSCLTQMSSSSCSDWASV